MIYSFIIKFTVLANYLSLLNRIIIFLSNLNLNKVLSILLNSFGLQKYYLNQK